MSDVKQQYFVNLEKQTMKNLQVGMYNYLGLDEEAISEMDKLLKEHDFVKEVFTNSYKLTFKEEQLSHMMKESVKLQNIMEEYFEDNNTTQEELELRISGAMQRFFDDFHEPIYKIVESSANRQSFIQE